MNFVQENNQVLYIWGGTISADIEQEVNQLKSIPGVKVNVENAERVLLGGLRNFSIILSFESNLLLCFRWLRPVPV